MKNRTTNKNRVRWRAALLLLILLTSLFACDLTQAPPAPPPPSPVVRPLTKNDPGVFFIETGDSPIQAGDKFTAKVYFNSGESLLGSYQLTIGFDSTLITPDLSSGASHNCTAGVDGFLENANISEAGVIKVGGFDLTGKGPGSALHLLNLNFTALAQGESPLTIEVRSQSDEAGTVIGKAGAVNGKVKVN